MGDVIQDIRLRKVAEAEKGLEAIHTLRDICYNQPDQYCRSGRCPIYDWCHNDKNEYPCDWV